MKQPPFQKRHSQYKAACRTSSKEKVKETQNAKEAYRKSLSNYKSQPEFILDHCSYLVSDFLPAVTQRPKTFLARDSVLVINHAQLEENDRALE